MIYTKHVILIQHVIHTRVCDDVEDITSNHHVATSTRTPALVWFGRMIFLFFKAAVQPRGRGA